MSTEQRLLLALVVSAAVVVLWSIFLAPTPQPAQNRPTEESTTEQTADRQTADTAQTEPDGDTATADETAENSVEETAAEQQPVTASEETERLVEVESDLYRVVLSNKAGGSAVSWELKQYEKSFNEEPFNILGAEEYQEEPYASFGTVLRREESFTNNQGEPGKRVQYTSLPGLASVSGDIAGGQLQFVDSKASVTFTYANEKFGFVSKTLTFYQNSYSIDVQLQFQARDPANQGQPMLLLGPGVGDLFRMKEDGTLEPANQMNGYLLRPSNSGVQKVNSFVTKAEAPQGEQEMLKEQRVSNFLVWAGLENNYFMSLAYSSTDSMFSNVYQIQRILDVKGETQEQFFQVPYMALRPENASQSSFHMFVGPKDLELLEKFAGGRLKEVVQFGWFGFISRPALWALKQINGFVHNYGFAIVLLTIALNLLLLPMIIKQRTSMVAMQKIQPQLKAVQAKYKVEKGDDIKTRQTKKAKMNEEVMALYKKENVNPMGGCLPLLIQMPILFALFDMIKIAIELRKAPFIFMWQDLSAPDPTFILPILMAVFMYLTQKITPQPADSNTGALKILPFIFLFFFAQAPSGLVLYWLTSSAFNFGTQVVMGQVAPMDAAAGGKEKGAKGKNKKLKGKK